MVLRTTHSVFGVAGSMSRRFIGGCGFSVAIRAGNINVAHKGNNPSEAGGHDGGRSIGSLCPHISTISEPLE